MRGLLFLIVLGTSLFCVVLVLFAFCGVAFVALHACGYCVEIWCALVLYGLLFSFGVLGYSVVALLRLNCLNSV